MSSEGFIQIQRSFLTDPLWLNLPHNYQHIFIVIIAHACFEPTSWDDHGHEIELQPGQLCTTIREIQGWCARGISKNEVERCIVKLKLYRFLRQEVRHHKSIITISDSVIYKKTKKKNETGSETTLRQDRDKIETEYNKVKNVNKNIRPKSQPKPKSLVSADASTLCSLFLKKLLEFKPDLKTPNVETWAKDFDKMLRLDKRSPEKVKQVIEWLTTSQFWRKNVLSAAKLREQFDRLQLAAEESSLFTSKESILERIKKRFVNGEAYNGYQCNFSEKSISFTSMIGQAHYELKLNENGFWDQLEGVLRKLSIN